MSSQYDEKFGGLNIASADLLKVLLKLESKTMKDIHVASICKVVSVDEPTVSVKPYPLLYNESEKVIKCYYLEGLHLNVNDIVVVLYTDREYSQVLKQLKMRQEPSKLNKSSELHSEKYGIIIGLIHSVSQNDI